MKVKRLYEIEELVKDILINEPRARKDDFYLISRLIERVKPHVLTMQVVEALNVAKEKNFPPFESITRARRKVQRKDPSLKDKLTEKARLNEVGAYVQYALGGNYEKGL